MTTEDLMKPRYKVIALWPNTAYQVGEIIHIEALPLPKSAEEMFQQYPHLFKPLQWWEDREEKDMPEYLKVNKRGKLFMQQNIYKVKHYSGKGGIVDHVRFIGEDTGHLAWFIPATIEEYTMLHQ